MNNEQKDSISVIKHGIMNLLITCYVPTLLDGIEFLLDWSFIHTISVDEKEDTKQYIKN